MNTPPVTSRPRSTSLLYKSRFGRLANLVAALALFAGIFSVGAIATAPSEAEAHPIANGPFGLGIILVDPTGLTGKYFFDDSSALDFHIGLDGLDNDRYDHIAFFIDYLFHIDTGVGSGGFAMLFYVGPGGTLVIIDDEHDWCTKFGCHDHDDDIALGARVPLGLSFLFGFGGEAFIELIPTLYFIPDFDFDLEVALGFRYYF